GGGGGTGPGGLAGGRGHRERAPTREAPHRAAEERRGRPAVLRVGTPRAPAEHGGDEVRAVDDEQRLRERSRHRGRKRSGNLPGTRKSDAPHSTVSDSSARS